MPCAIVLRSPRRACWAKPCSGVEGGAAAHACSSLPTACRRRARACGAQLALTQPAHACMHAPLPSLEGGDVLPAPSCSPGRPWLGRPRKCQPAAQSWPAYHKTPRGARSSRPGVPGAWPPWCAAPPACAQRAGGQRGRERAPGRAAETDKAPRRPTCPGEAPCARAGAVGCSSPPGASCGQGSEPQAAHLEALRGPRR